MRLEIEGGKTNYDGPYAVSKFSKLSVVKSKVSPLMGDFPVSIDITKGGVINRSESFVWWMTQITSPAVFKQAAWWSIEDWCYEKYKVYWDKFPDFYPRFRQAKLYEVAAVDSNFTDFLQLIWLDLISERYTLQKEVCRGLRERVEAQLMLNLGITYDQLNTVQVDTSTGEVITDVSEETLSDLASLLGVDETQETPE